MSLPQQALLRGEQRNVPLAIAHLARALSKKSW
jgi:hypothetical protein